MQPMTSNGRAETGGIRGKKRSKNWYRSSGAAKRARRGGPLAVGMEGFLVTCNYMEQKCAVEAFDVLTDYAENIFGQEVEPAALAQSPRAGEKLDDMEMAVKEEVEKLKGKEPEEGKANEGSAPSPRFKIMESGSNNVIFIRTQSIDPTLLAWEVLNDVAEKRRARGRNILRLIPVGASCKAYATDLARLAERFLEPYFGAPRQSTFQVVFKARNNQILKRDNVIQILADIVTKMNPNNKVNLSTPDLTIIVEVIKNVCCLSVVRDYSRLRKYNLQEVAREGAAQIPVVNSEAAGGGGEREKEKNVPVSGHPDDCVLGTAWESATLPKGEIEGGQAEKDGERLKGECSITSAVEDEVDAGRMSREGVKKDDSGDEVVTKGYGVEG
uniref:THUMP domain-containing protein 1 n=1 Tax=Myxine glutinosa TaxID=7769 RepID=UPI00358E0AA6